ncbi:MAG: helix-turn-helix domain-containing protein [bacterium]
MEKEKRLTASQVADALGISVAKLISWQKRGALPPAPKVGRKRYYTEEYLEKAKEFVEKYMGAVETKELLGINDALLQNLVKAGILTVKRVKGRRLFLKEEVEELKKKCPTPEEVKGFVKDHFGQSISWVAKQLGISRQTFYTWLKKGVLTPPKKGDKIFFTRADVEEIKKKLAQRLERAHRIRVQVLRSRKK